MQQIQLNLNAQETLQLDPIEKMQNVHVGGQSFQEILTSIQKESKREEVAPVEEKIESHAQNDKFENDEEEVDDNKNKIIENHASYVFFQKEIPSDDEQIKFVDAQELLEEQTEILPLAKAQDEKISTKEIDWLLSKEKVNDDLKVEVKVEDLASLIEQAEEFVPGEESDEELLIQAQNLALKDPQEFLNKTQEIKIPIETKNFDLNSKKAQVVKNDSKNQVKFTVQDLRTKQTQENIVDSKAVTKTQSKSLNLEYKQVSENQIQVTMDLSNAAQQDITSSSSQAAASNGSTFQSMLQNSITANAQELVKAGSIILKDNNQGNINMILRPESLGNVKVSLSLSDKVITGQIVVHTQEAYEAMKDSIEVLKQAFAQNGFETGEFNLNFQNQNQFAQQNKDGQQQDSFNAQRVYGDFISVTDQSENDTMTAFLPEYSSLNIVA